MNKEVMNILVIGDSYYIVPVFVTDWITSKPKATGVREDIPEEVLGHFGIYEEDSKVMLGMFTYENDRALIIAGYAPMYESMSEVFEHFQDNNHTMGEEFHYEEY